MDPALAYFLTTFGMSLFGYILGYNTGRNKGYVEGCKRNKR